jgi:hypothetical protein
MTPMSRWTVYLILVAGFVASTALASTTTLDARSLALREQDFPRPATRVSQKENRTAPLPGGTGHAYTTTFRFRVGRRTQEVGTIVITAPTTAIARRVYADAVAEARKTVVSMLRLPPLGDQQYAALSGRSSLDETSGLVWVRRSTVVWQVQVASIRNPFGFTRAEALTELAAYALKQKRRVGAASMP